MSRKEYYICETLTDFSILPKILKFWKKNITHEELVKKLSRSDINTDLIEEEDLPSDFLGGYSDIYYWLARDIRHLMRNCGFINSNNELTELGENIKSGKEDLYNGLNAGLTKNWQSEKKVLPKFFCVIKRH